MTSHSATASLEYPRRKTGGNPFIRVARGIAVFFGDLARASEAAATYRRLSYLSDAALAKRGLTREDLPSYVFESTFSR